MASPTSLFLAYSVASSSSRCMPWFSSARLPPTCQVDQQAGVEVRLRQQVARGGGLVPGCFRNSPSPCSVLKRRVRCSSALVLHHPYRMAAGPALTRVPAPRRSVEEHPSAERCRSLCDQGQVLPPGTTIPARSSWGSLLHRYGELPVGILAADELNKGLNLRAL